MRESKNRFDYYREIEAKYASTASCGHAVDRGDHIGYNPRIKPARTVCAFCWRKWVAENAEYAALERDMG